jgi:GntR family transcriptional regulator
VLISIDPELRQPIYTQIVDEVRRGRVLGTLRPGETLPSVRQLAADLGINPNTVKQAYRELEREGLVHVRRGEGTFVTELEVDGAERERMLRSVAEWAVAQAQRLDAGTEELIEAVRALERSNETEAS